MTHDELEQRHRDAIMRNWRTMADRDGHVPQRLLTELANIADQHAVEENLKAVERVLAARQAEARPPDPPGGGSGASGGVRRAAGARQHRGADRAGRDGGPGERSS